jgi:hypothetical protein
MCATIFGAAAYTNAAANAAPRDTCHRRIKPYIAAAASEKCSHNRIFSANASGSDVNNASQCGG